MDRNQIRMKRVLAAFGLLTACAPTNQPHAPVGDSMLAGPFVATLIQTEEYRLPEVPRRPENDRYKLSLLLHSLDGSTRRTVPIKSGLRATDFLHGARMIFDDGQRLYFHAHEPLAYNYATGNLSVADSPRHRSRSTPAPKDYRAPAGALCKDCKRPALLLATPNGNPQKLDAPDSLLLLHRSNRAIFGTELLSRATPDGKLLWTADTSLLDVDQIIPSSSHTVFIGREAAPKPDAFRPPVLVIVNNKDGAVLTRPL